MTNPTPHIPRQGSISSTRAHVYNLAATATIEVYGNEWVYVDGAAGTVTVTCVGDVGVGAQIWFSAPDLTTSAALVLPNGDVFRGGSNTTVTLDADDEVVWLHKITETTWIKAYDPDSAATS